jgi:(1->4)-alpha-D-glucan 1-alpha-D-glucosylmutase
MGPAAAKGVEDTALYRDVRLVSRNEVGGDPGVAPIGVEEFHRRVRSMREGPWPLVATTTHDTKRSEDVRARIAVLSELPEEWERRVRRWSRANGELRRSIHGGAVPSPDEELFLYQTLVGAWPLGEAGDLEERIRAYVVKAAREARLRTSWLDPDASYEALLEGFVHDALTSDRFRHDLEGFVRIVAYHGALNSLAQVVLKAFLPGATDVYQGTETWRLDLVDPDNRRPVDFGALTRMLEELDGSVVDPERLLAEWPDGRIKLFVTASALRLRRERPVPFVAGSYLPLAARGPKADHVIALVRRSRRQWVMAVVPRLTLRLAGAARPDLGANGAGAARGRARPLARRPDGSDRDGPWLRGRSGSRSAHGARAAPRRHARARGRGTLSRSAATRGAPPRTAPRSARRSDPR